MSEIYRALADPTRRRILELLREREMSAGEIAANFATAKATISGHFSVLRAANLVHAERRKSQVIYRLNLSVLEEAVLALAKSFRLGEDAYQGPAPYGEEVARG